MERKMDGILKDMDQLTIEQPTSLKTISAKLDALSDSVRRLGQDMETTKSHQDGLRTIHFERLNCRYERISGAYINTFEWAFEDEAPGVHGLVKLRFRDWLEGGDGIFWVRGKAGSGKSTLMKLLVNDSRTLRSLKAWAGVEAKLVFAKYFFWNPGTSLQKSQEGLVRAFLFDILCQCPQEIPMAERLLSRRTESSQDNSIGTWETAWDILKDVLAAIATSSTSKICLFIDGLDEYEGESDNLIEMVRVLSSFQGVKVCVSSRPWAEFVLAFGTRHDRLLKVEDLTARDIHSYARGNLFANSRFAKLASRDDTIPQLVDVH
jgi:hypothetical protein